MLSANIGWQIGLILSSGLESDDDNAAGMTPSRALSMNHRGKSQRKGTANCNEVRCKIPDG